MNSCDIVWEGLDQPVWSGRIHPFIDRVLSTIGVDGWEISITFCTDSFIRDLNASYRNLDEATDVLTFPQLDFSGQLDSFEQNDAYLSAGDIVVSLTSVETNAEYFRVSFDEELRRVLIHGILHLKGLDHATNDAVEPMLLFQEQILASLKDTLITP